jgi:hypothetical protein
LRNELEPAITIGARRLDREEHFEVPGSATHSVRSDIGQFMLKGGVLSGPGCW